MSGGLVGERFGPEGTGVEPVVGDEDDGDVVAGEF
jgi:hypothetical protein